MKTKSLIQRVGFNKYKAPDEFLEKILGFSAKYQLKPEHLLKVIYQYYRKDWELYDIFPNHLYNRSLGLYFLSNYPKATPAERMELIKLIYTESDYGILSYIPKKFKNIQQAQTKIFEKVIENYIASGWLLFTGNNQPMNNRHALLNLPGALWVTLFPSLKIQIEKFQNLHIQAVLTTLRGITDPKYLTQVNNSLERFTKSATEELLSKE